MRFSALCEYQERALKRNYVPNSFKIGIGNGYQSIARQIFPIARSSL
ncbi:MULTISPECIES: hypothetical protein [unclassified Microcoleus]|nr:MULTISPECIES: hypothetical protein [unclassified Microcoleus]